MLPRGEVGLIFATIGLTSGVFDDDLYAALLLVVLATTLVTPMLLRRRYESLGSTPVVLEPGTRSTPPPGGWLQIINGEIELSARPAPHLTLQIALDAARYVADARPSKDLLDWFSSTRGRTAPLVSSRDDRVPRAPGEKQRALLEVPRRAERAAARAPGARRCAARTA